MQNACDADSSQYSPYKFRSPGLFPIRGGVQQLDNKTELFPTPIGHRISAALGEAMLFGAIGKHGPYFGSATVLALEYDVPPIRRPRGEILPPRIVRELGPPLAGDIHDVDVLSSRCTRAIFAIP